MSAAKWAARPLWKCRATSQLASCWFGAGAAGLTTSWPRSTTYPSSITSSTGSSRAAASRVLSSRPASTAPNGRTGPISRASPRSPTFVLSKNAATEEPPGTKPDRPGDEEYPGQAEECGHRRRMQWQAEEVSPEQHQHRLHPEPHVAGQLGRISEAADQWQQVEAARRPQRGGHQVRGGERG